MPHRVLVVDDQLIQREHLRGLLEREGVFHVETVESVHEALEIMEHARFDVVLSDLLMPELDGIQFIQRLSLKAGHPALALMSSSPRGVIDGACMLAETLGIRVVARISKPVTPSAVQSLLARLQVPAEQRAEVGTGAPQYKKGVLEDALASGQIQAWYQPKVRVADGLVVGVEALARWVLLNDSVLAPRQFLPSIINGGMENELLMKMIEQTLGAQDHWMRHGHGVQVSINLPCHLLEDYSLPDKLHKFVVERGGKPEMICFELTEGSTTQDLSDYYAGACRLRIKGFGLAQDDSGQGYSSMFSIATTPFTEIKLDRSLVSRCAREDGAYAAVDSIVRLGRRLGLNVVAEGVETQEQLATLRVIGCDVVQGFLVSRALTRDLLCDFLSKCGSAAP